MSTSKEYGTLSIGSAVFAGLTTVTDRRTDGQTDLQTDRLTMLLHL